MYEDKPCAMFMCPVTGLEMNGKFHFLLNFTSGLDDARVPEEAAYDFMETNKTAPEPSKKALKLRHEKSKAAPEPSKKSPKVKKADLKTVNPKIRNPKIRNPKMLNPKIRNPKIRNLLSVYTRNEERARKTNMRETTPGLGGTQGGKLVKPCNPVLPLTTNFWFKYEFRNFVTQCCHLGTNCRTWRR